MYSYTFAGWNTEIVSVTSNATYTATYTSSRLPFFVGHSLSLGGNIGVNFFLSLTEEQAKDLIVSFSWTVNGVEKTATSTLVKDNVTGYYKASCPVAVAEMTYIVTASVTVDNETYTDDYSAAQYADTILNNEEFISSYKTQYGNDKY